MKIAVPKEIHPGECRVAQTPDSVQRLIKLGFEVSIESDAGSKADFSDQAYQTAGCSIVNSREQLWSEADVVLKVRPPEEDPELGQNELDRMRSGSLLVSFFWPAQNPDLVEHARERGVTLLAIDQVPRITRAQKMDALSSMANIAGYRSVIEAAEHFGRFFTGQITAAGKVPPAKVLVIGAGVAGLAAIGTARGLGAIVKAFDTRPAVEEQVASMGAEYVTLEFEEEGTGTGGYAKVMSESFMDAERALFEELAVDTDIIISTALIPGKPAPVLITEQALKNMKPGSVVVDLAAEQGGNCPFTEADQVVSKHGVKLIGYTDLPSRMASVSSNLYGNNLVHLMDELGGADSFQIDESNEVVRGALVCHQGELKWPPPRLEPSPPSTSNSGPASASSASEQKQSLSEIAAAKQQDTHEATEPATNNTKWRQLFGNIAGAILICVLLGLIGLVEDSEFLSHLTVFVLACIIGWQVVWNVTPALHTPLMGVTNAISGIIVVGGILQVTGPLGSPAGYLGAIAIAVATVNIAGGFVVTQRMLKMFKK